jgi:hypothetical protein
MTASLGEYLPGYQTVSAPQIPFSFSNPPRRGSKIVHVGVGLLDLLTSGHYHYRRS